MGIEKSGDVPGRVSALRPASSEMCDHPVRQFSVDGRYWRCLTCRWSTRR